MGGTSVVVDPAKLTASGERTLRRLASLAATQMPPEQFLTALGTAVEVHVSRLIGFLVELSDIDTTPFGRALLATVEGSMTYTWEDRHKWLDRGFDVAVAGHLAGQRFDTVVEARNSVVHGDGFLSDKQAGRALEKITALRKRYRDELDIGLVAGRLAFTQSSSDQLHEAARRHIAYLDSIVLSKYPKVAHS